MARDQFPTGMRVLAVDDDPTCLRVLEALLIRCQYHVTTTNQAITALQMLRESKDRFDLVISDVHMPDMDGFKLLELVGLEMDLPVIMLSANGETKTVMKGITHGACDYLLKPVRIEELRNIWQHVVRRKFSHRERNNQVDVFDECDRVPNADAESALGAIPSAPSDYNEKPSKKRKEINSEDEDGHEEYAQDGEDISTQKKPRVVWSVDLHRKFVAAVNQLGIDKAVPKRILELMNVDKLTRENVASHLQKYRLYLKRLSVVASQQASLVAAIGSRDPSYLRMGMFEGLQNCKAWASPSHIPSLASMYPPEVLSRTNASVLGELQGFALPKDLRNSCIGSGISSSEDFNKFQLIGLSERQDRSTPQGLATPMGQELLQHKWIQDGCDLPVNFSEGGTTGCSNSVFQDVTDSRLLQQPKLAASSSLSVTHGNEGTFQYNVQSPPKLPDAVRPLDSNQGAISVSGFPPDNLLMVGSLGNTDVPKPEANFPVVPQDGKKYAGVYSGSIVASDVIRDSGSLILPPHNGEDPRLFNTRCPGSSSQKIDDRTQDLAHNSMIPWSSVANSQLTSNVSTTSTLVNQRLNTGTLEAISSCMIAQTSAPSAALDQHGQLNQADEPSLGISSTQSEYMFNGCNFDGLLNSIVKVERDDDIFFPDSDIGCDLYQLGECI